MAGMLAGVECARRRRLGGSSDSAHSWRHSSFRGVQETHHATISQITRIINDEHGNDNLGGAVGEAKQRLHDRLRHRKYKTKRELEMEGKSKRFSWMCLDSFNFKGVRLEIQ